MQNFSVESQTADKLTSMTDGRVSKIQSDLSLTGETRGRKSLLASLSDNLLKLKTLAQLETAIQKILRLCFKENGHAHGVCGR